MVCAVSSLSRPFDGSSAPSQDPTKKRQSRVEVPLLMDPIAPRDLDFDYNQGQVTTCRRRPNKPSPDLPAETGTGWASSQLATGSASKIATPDGGWADGGQAR